MKVQKRINLLVQLGEYLLASPNAWQQCTENAYRQNPWFTPEFVQTATGHIVHTMLQREILENFAARYPLSNNEQPEKTVGMVLPGNIPLAGFHDILCGLLSGHRLLLKLPEKAGVLTEHLVQQLHQWAPELETRLQTATQLKNCDAYIATGSNNTSRYFEHYFGKYPSIIRHNRTSIAILNGAETTTQLEALASDVHLYFGLGCRNVTKIYVPAGYDFVPLLNAFSRYDYFKDHNRYKNNYDYQLALLILNKQYYMTNGTILLTENKHLFSPVSQVFYEYYTGDNQPATLAPGAAGELQCVVGNGHIPYGQAQVPAIDDFADGADTMEFLVRLN
ncbi:MAG: acyl-CoA reductase [Dinghuibacter sp.]|nr:acyl-CoA reductase [Dinghuibacter sp.]